jgi:dTDP-D-glucose 4,6-dehydratase
METELGFCIERRFEDGLAQTLDWYLATATGSNVTPSPCPPG